MSYKDEFRQALDLLLTQFLVAEDGEEKGIARDTILDTVEEKILESFKNGIEVGVKRASVKAGGLKSKPRPKREYKASGTSTSDKS